MRSFFDQDFLVAEGLKHVEIGSFTIEDALNLAFAGDVFDLSSTERIAFHDTVVVLNILDFRNHVFPDVHSCVGLRFVELDFEQESALEGRVEVLGEVGGGDEDAVELLHLLKDDVLHGVLHLLNRAVDVGEAVA